MTQSNNRSKGKKNRARKSNLKTRQQSPTKALLINEMPKAGLSQCQKNPVAGSAQVVCEKLAACRALDKGPVETVSSRQAAGSMDITEPKVNVSPKDESRGMHPTDGCDSRTVKSVEKHADSDSIASIDDDEDIYSGNGQSTSEERQDITEDPVSNHNEFTKKGVLDTKNIAGSLDSGDEQTKIRGSQADSTASEDIAASTSSSAPVDSHRSREPWQRWSKEKKQELHDKLLEKIEHLQSERTCKVCLSAEVSRAFRPCGHLSCCASCAKQMKDCPICRQPVQGSVVVVLPKPRRKALPMDFELFLQRHSYFGL